MFVPVPADGVKGKTWGPSTVHQRSRAHLPLPASSAPPLLPRVRARFCSSAPELPPAPRPAGTRPPARRQPELARKRSGSHDDLLDPAAPRRNRSVPLCPLFSLSARPSPSRSPPPPACPPDRYGTVYGAPPKGKGSFLRSIRSSSLTGLLAAPRLASEATELLHEDE